jgi:hypothetical protein
MKLRAWHLSPLHEFLMSVSVSICVSPVVGRQQLCWNVTVAMSKLSNWIFVGRFVFCAVSMMSKESIRRFFLELLLLKEAVVMLLTFWILCLCYVCLDCNVQNLIGLGVRNWSRNTLCRKCFLLSVSDIVFTSTCPLTFRQQFWLRNSGKERFPETLFFCVWYSFLLEAE